MPHWGRIPPQAFNLASFQPCTYMQDEWGVSLLLNYPLDLAIFESPLNIAFGAEYRNEVFTTVGGDLASYQPCEYRSRDLAWARMDARDSILSLPVSGIVRTICFC